TKRVAAEPAKRGPGTGRVRAQFSCIPPSMRDRGATGAEQPVEHCARTAAETHERVEIVLAMQKITKRARHARDRVGYGERTGAGHRSGASGQESRQHGRATHVARLHVQELRTCLATVAGIAGVEREV